MNHPADAKLSRRAWLRAAAGVSGLAGYALAAPQKIYWPRGADWETRAPRDAGMDAAGIEDALNYAAERSSTGLVILRGGRIVAEKYWQDWTPQTAQPIFSSSKSVAATLIGMAIEEGKLKGVNQSLADFIPSWKGSPKEAITLRHVMTMTSGIKVGGAAVSASVDAFEATAAFPLEHKPGEHWAYNTPVYRMLLRVIEMAYGESINQFTQRKLAAPIGISHSSWDCSPAPNGKTKR